MKLMITLSDSTTEDLETARQQLGRDAEKVQGLADKVREGTLELGRFLISVRDSGRTTAALKASEIRKASVVDGRRTGFSKWYTDAGLGKSEVSAWIRYAETVDASGLDLSGLAQGAVLALASADDDERRKVLEMIKDSGESISAPRIRETRKVLEGLRDPGPTTNENENENDDDDDDDDDDDRSEMDSVLDDLEAVGFNGPTTRTPAELRSIANGLLGLANALEDN